MPSLVLAATWAAAGGSDHHLPRRAAQRAAGALRRGRGRRRRHLAQGLARHPAAAARRDLRHADPAAHRDRAGVPRAVPVHRGRSEQRDGHGAAAHLPLRVPEQPRRRLRRGDGAEPHARDRARAVLVRCTSSSPRNGATVDRPRHPRAAPRPFAGAARIWSPSTSRRPTAASCRRTTAASAACKTGMGVVHVILFVGLIVVGLGPLLLLAKSAITPTADIISTPLAFFPNGIDWANLTQAWVDVEVGKYFFNTIVVAFGSWAFAIVISTTGGYVLSVLQADVREDPQHRGARDPVHPVGRAARAALHHGRAPGDRAVAAQQLPRRSGCRRRRTRSSSCS